MNTVARVKDLSTVKKIALTAFFTVAGVLLPYLTSHAFGIMGTVHLPMHIPVLLCGLLLGVKYGAVCGFLSPLLSHYITGMPANLPFMPMLPIMLVELTLYGAVSGLLYKNLKLPLFISLPVAMIIGRCGYAIMFAILLSQNPSIKPLTMPMAVLTGWVGILIQLIVIPIILGVAGGKKENV
ncbi:MAG: ECF transporter S component [Firmicutes bacterium]|nr:ECF transporter S component [Bacillota bacterium]